ncbi:uncharacterized protein RHO25_003306 [Cercospora beticola]|uniref:F-box domain-containing protein n=1 Tax=Cercospora beticola TaxID=122368 RepID=A0ABZ0NGN4_CERBT|nr:hypothetical protein RHO25_003306 [Cercospora beticola]
MASTDLKPPGMSRIEVGNSKEEEPTFRLLDLPPELQLRIFEYAVTMDEPISINRRAWPRLIGRPLTIEERDHLHPLDLALGFNSEERAARVQPAITRVSRAIRADVIKIYYKNNTFDGRVLHLDESQFRHDILDVDPCYRRGESTQYTRAHCLR